VFQPALAEDQRIAAEVAVAGSAGEDKLRDVVCRFSYCSSMKTGMCPYLFSRTSYLNYFYA